MHTVAVPSGNCTRFTILPAGCTQGRTLEAVFFFILWPEYGFCQIVKYNRKVIDYVVLHQYCHLKYKTHSKKFYDMLKKYVPNYETLARQLPNLKY